MSTATKFGLAVAVALLLSQSIAPGAWGPAVILGFIAIFSVSHAVIARKRAGFELFSYSLAVNAVSAVLLAVLLVLRSELPRSWALGMGLTIVLGLVLSALLARLQRRARPTAWREFRHRLKHASFLDLLLGRPLRTST